MERYEFATCLGESNLKLIKLTTFHRKFYNCAVVVDTLLVTSNNNYIKAIRPSLNRSFTILQTLTESHRRCKHSVTWMFVLDLQTFEFGMKFQ